jgi:L-fuculose-phosphate aldolase
MPKHGAVTVGPDCAAAVMYAVLLERACRTALSAIAAGGPTIWSDDDETALKLEQIWNPAGLGSGYDYLVRSSRRDSHNG